METPRRGKTVLLSFAHPDDESFAVGGTVAKYAARGWEIFLFSATAGEAGASGEFSDIRGEQLGALRKTELADAARMLGIRDVAIGDFPDGKLKDTEPGDLDDRIYRKMIEVAPDIVITFDTTGISNHPDHIRISYATTFAFQKYAAEIESTHRFIRDTDEGVRKGKNKFIRAHQHAFREERFVDRLDRPQAPMLYYACIPESTVGYLKTLSVFPDEMYGKPVRGIPDKMVSAVINIKPTAEAKRRALLCHRTQADDVDRFLSVSTNPLFSQEYFYLRMVGTTETVPSPIDRVKDRLG